MRLTSEQHRTIRRAATQAFGSSARVRLFGSRVDDATRGGDFDLYVETEETDPDRLEAARRTFLQQLHAAPCLEDEPIDVVIHSPLHSDERAIDQVARQEGIAL